MIAELKGAPLGKFAIQLDESSDVPACAQLCMYDTSVVKITRKISCSVIS